MADDGGIRLTEDAVRSEIDNYSYQHPNDFGVDAQEDERSRIPMKKLMKIFQIKKKSSMERQNLFRSIVNDICDLEVMDDIGKVLILKENATADGEAAGEDMGYGDAAPTIQTSSANANNDNMDDNGSAHFSVATTEGIGIVEKDMEKKVQRKGYKRRGSVTRYSIVAQDAVVDEYKKHEDIINQFRGDSNKIENQMKRLSIGDAVNNVNNDSNGRDGSAKSGKNGLSGKNGSDHSKGRRQQSEVDADGNIVKRFFRRGRFSLAF